MAELELPTLAQIADWDVQHLVDAAVQWNKTAELWENSFHDVWQGTLRPGGTTWEGSAAENAQDIAWRDLVKVRGSADSLRVAANIAHAGAASLSDVKRLALNAITDEIPDALNEEQRQSRGIVALPASLTQALDCLRNSEALIEALPQALLDTYFALKTEELTLTEQLSPAELCEHYARLY